MTHGAMIGAICAVLPGWLMQWGLLPAGVGFFVAIFLVVRCARSFVLQICTVIIVVFDSVFGHVSS